LTRVFAFGKMDMYTSMVPGKKGCSGERIVDLIPSWEGREGWISLYILLGVYLPFREVLLVNGGAPAGLSDSPLRRFREWGRFSRHTPLSNNN